jgi:FkbM family methyltransferase
MLAPIAFYRELVCGKWDGGAEDHVIAFIQNNLGSGETFFDVGAWIGVYSLLASRLVGRTGRVYAFEPDDMARQVLASNLRLNDARNVEVVPKALSDHVGEAPFGSNWHIGPLSLPCSRTGQILDESATGTKLQGAMKVPTTTLDDFSETIGRVPDMVKIDVEGHEVEVVRGAMLTLSNPKTTIILELHCETLSRKGYSPSTFLEQLEGIRPVKVLTAHGRLSSPHRVHLSDVVGHHIVMPRLK